MKSNWSAVMDGKTQRKIGSMIEPVCSAENESVDMRKIKHAHSTAGHQARNHAGISKRPSRGCTSGSCGAGRGLRQGCSDTNRTLRFDVSDKPQGCEGSRTALTGRLHSLHSLF